MNQFLTFIFLFFLSSNFVPTQAAVSMSPENASQKYAPKEPKKLEKKITKMCRSNFAGLEAYGYIAMFFLIMILMGLGLVLSLIFKWKIAAWIFGVIFGIQVLICLLVLFALLFF